MLRAIVFFALVTGAGCTAVPPAPPLAEQNLELTSTGFYPQDTNQCGPAALTSVLQSSNVEAKYDQVAQQVFLPERGGSLQLEMLAAARSFGRLPVRVPTQPAGIVAQLAQGRPVLVMQNLGLALVPIWHYAVVVGYQADSDEFVLRSGSKRRHLMTRRSFTRTWERADNWGIVLLRPDEPISGLEPAAYLTEAAALETLGRFAESRTAYQQARRRWPDLSLATLGLANSLLGLGDYDGARVAYRSVLTTEPRNLAARNNLAHTLAQLGCVEQAVAVINSTPESASEQIFYPQLMATRHEIESMQRQPPADALSQPIGRRETVAEICQPRAAEATAQLAHARPD